MEQGAEVGPGGGALASRRDAGCRVPATGGVASLNHRLQAGFPPGTVAGGPESPRDGRREGRQRESGAVPMTHKDRLLMFLFRNMWELIASSRPGSFRAP